VIIVMECLCVGVMIAAMRGLTPQEVAKTVRILPHVQSPEILP
jgi:hypothetical protein